MKGKALRKHSLHEKTAASVLLWPFINTCSLYNCGVCVFQYADPVADLLDKWGVFRARLFRESCVFHRGNYVKVNKHHSKKTRVILQQSVYDVFFHATLENAEH